MTRPLLVPTAGPAETPVPRTSPVLVIATVDNRTPKVRGVDWIRIDGADGTLEAIARRGADRALPVLFDVPGPNTRRRGSLLTTSEYLVFAAAEGYEWVNLRGVSHPDDVIYAREFVPDSVRVSVTLASPRVIRENLGVLCSVSDAILLDRHALRHALGARRGDALLGSAVRHASDRGTPTLLTSDVLPSMLRNADPSSSDVARLSDLVDDGLCGLVLTREVTNTIDPQSRIDVARLVAQAGRTRGPGTSAPDIRPAARVVGNVSVVRETNAARALLAT